uniref:Beta-hexosaminidase n=1 Tax=Nilaparvata lugens TaxID=108931 RepID=A0A0C5CUE7_NILLU|nr:beta-N-acetylhexosaminidase [Nilaparvata lugens]
MPKFNRVRYTNLTDGSTAMRRWICYRTITNLKNFFVNSKSAKYLLAILVTILTIQQICFMYTEPSSPDIAQNIRGLWTYKCMKNRCRKTQFTGKDGEDSGQISLNVCKLTCGDPPGSLWPMPTGKVQIQRQLVAINPNNIIMEDEPPGNQEMNTQNGKVYLALRGSFSTRLLTETVGKPIKADGGYEFHLTLQIQDTSVDKPTLNMDESYQLKVETDNDKKLVQGTIIAKTYFGARHATETLNQLIVYDDVSRKLVMPGSIEIFDQPVYKYRALMLDTSRNFISIEAIRRTIDGMASVKMNVLHWHITDSHSFPLESKMFPQLTIYGAYGPDQFYSQKEVKSLVEFARWKGVKIVPEFDSPAHVGEGWQWADNTLIGFNAQPWFKICNEAPCGLVNPISDRVFEMLQGILSEMHDLFDISEVFHMGGDEVNLLTWKDDKEIQAYMKKRQWDDKSSLFRLWGDFHKRTYSILQKVTATSPRAILWTSKLTGQEYIDEILDKKHYIIHVWSNATLAEKNIEQINQIRLLAKKGYQMIFSNSDALYLDCGFGGWVTDGHNWCSPYKTWQQLYSNDMVAILKDITRNEYKPEMDRLIYGASAAMWTEQVDEHNLDGRVWPRLAALAERLWTNPSTPWQVAEFRFLHQRERLVRYGIHPEALQPLWCRQNEGDCPDTTPKPRK